MKIVITRSREASKTLVPQIARPCFHEPLLSFEPKLPPEAWESIAQATDLIVTSAQVFKLYPQLARYADKTLWCVGDVTAAAGQALGFQQVKVASRRAENLLSLILEQGDAKGHYVYLSTQNPHTDITQLLLEKNFRADTWVAYETHYAENLSPEFKDMLCGGGPLLIPFYSFNTMKKFIELIQKENLGSALNNAYFLVPRSEMVTYLHKFSWKKVQIWPNLKIEDIQKAYDAIMTNNLSMSQRLKWGFRVSVVINLVLMGVLAWGYTTYTGLHQTAPQKTTVSTSLPIDETLQETLRADMQKHAEALQSQLVRLEENLAQSWEKSIAPTILDPQPATSTPDTRSAQRPTDDALLQVYRGIIHQLYTPERSTVWAHEASAWAILEQHHIILTDSQQELLMQRLQSIDTLMQAAFKLWNVSRATPFTAQPSASETSLFGRLPYIGDGLKIRIRPAPESKVLPAEDVVQSMHNLRNALWHHDTQTIQKIMADIPDSEVKQQWYEDCERVIQQRALLHTLEGLVYAQLVTEGNNP